MDGEVETAQAAAREAQEVQALMEACLDTTEREFARLRGAGEADGGSKHWAEAQQLLRKARSVMQSLMRRQRSVIALAMAAKGLDAPDQAPPDTKPPPDVDATASADNCAAGDVEPRAAATPVRSRPELLPESGHKQSWEQSVLRKIRRKLGEKRDEQERRGRSTARIDEDIARIEAELSGLDSDFQARPVAEVMTPAPVPVASPGWSVTPVARSRERSGSASAARDFEHMVTKIMAGATPDRRGTPQNTKELVSLISATTPSEPRVSRRLFAVQTAEETR